MNSKFKNQDNNSNRERSVFFHNFQNFSTTSPAVAIKIQLIRALSIILGILIVAYILIEFLIVLNIIQNKNEISIRQEIDIKSAKIEKAYNQKIGTLTEEYALNNGFVKVDMDHFATRLDKASNLSFLYGETR